MAMNRTRVAVLVAVAVAAGGGVYGWSALQKAQAAGRWMLGRECAFGSEVSGAGPPQGTERWCQELDAGGAARRHGVYREWYPSGAPKTEGWYVHGKKHGRWYQWSEAGRPTVRRKYNQDRDDGFLITCSDVGAPLSLQVYDLGKRGELLDAAELSRRAAKAGPEDLGHFRWGQDAITAWCSGKGKP
jgi:hypothetical protein